MWQTAQIILFLSDLEYIKSSKIGNNLVILGEQFATIEHITTKKVNQRGRERNKKKKIVAMWFLHSQSGLSFSPWKQCITVCAPIRGDYHKIPTEIGVHCRNFSLSLQNSPPAPIGQV